MLSIYNIKKWYLMMTGKSLLHVNQDIGKFFSKDDLKGYYNNLTEKVTRQPQLLNSDELPQYLTPHKELIHFPVAIFQYGLGAYDMYLKTNEDKYIKKFHQCLEWTLAHQEPTGAWNNFSHIYPDNPYGAMAQGEATSLLLRAYMLTKESRYLEAAKRAIDFMLKPVEEGGTTAYQESDIILLEYTHLPAVLNGWIFAWWGLYDYVLVTKDKNHYSQLLEQSLQTIETFLPRFDRGYWSQYDLDGHIASPFYHHLHIAQMQALYQLTGHETFRHHATRWQNFELRRLNKYRAFCVKAYQKLVSP